MTVEEDEETTCIRVLRELKPEELELPGVISVEKILELELVGAEVDAVELLELESDEEFVELRLELLVLETDDDFVELIECVVDVPEEENVDALVELEVLDDETEDVLVLVNSVELFDEVVETTVETRVDELCDVVVIITRVLELDTTELVEERLVVFQGGSVTVLLKS